MILTPQCEIDAINEILSSIGNSPINTAEDSENIDVINARHILKMVSRDVQSQGWAFNRETNVFLKPEAETLEVPYPENFIKVTAKGYQLIRKDKHIFDTQTRTSVFPTGISVDLIRELPFEELPEVFRKYITTKSARIFQERFLTDNELTQILQFEEQEARMYLIDYDLETGDYNIFRGDTFISQNINR